MPRIKSAMKRVRVTRKRTLRNARIKSTVKTFIKRFEEALAAKDQERAGAKLKEAISNIDKAVSKGVWHKNTAARKKSRLTKKFNSLAG